MSALPGARRDSLAKMLALATAICVALAFLLSTGTQFLMPGPLTSAHGAIEKCDACHTKSGDGKLSWVHGLIAGDPLADSKACLTCHKMRDTAFNAHSASADALKQSTERMMKIAAELPAPLSARAQNAAFSTDKVVARDLYCATCHQEHQGGGFKLNTISNEQCRSCHTAKFDSFDGLHPKFDNYPFERRTRIVYDHAGHFGKHYPELAKKEPAKRIPATCSTCHNSNADKRVMATAPFDQTCAGCHLDQIIGKERVSGPKGIAFLALPGLDVQTLNKKNARIGEWPEASDAALTPFMKVMMSRSERGRGLLKLVDGLNLQDLTGASDDQIKAVADLVWEMKQLFHALISGKASDVLADLNIGAGAKLSKGLVADLTANIPRDVVISAQQQWLPNLATEIAKGPDGIGSQQDAQSAATKTQPNSAGSAPPEKPAASDAPEPDAAQAAPGADSEAESAPDAGSEAPPAKAKLDPPACSVRVFGQCLVSKESEDKTDAAGQTDSANPKPDSGKAEPSSDRLAPAMRAGLRDVAQAIEASPAGATPRAAIAKPNGGKERIAANEQPTGKATDQKDELLFPTEDERREIDARSKDGGKSRPEAAGNSDAVPAAASKTDAGGADAGAAAATSRTGATPVISIESDVDPETWAEYGGWYRQDYAIFYRPTGHKDKFIYSWLFLTGPQSAKGGASPAAAVFDYLASKDAQGSCTKCHSVDDLKGKGRVVNFSPASVASKQGRFTSFVHEPHFGLLDNRGCLTCHKLEKDQTGESTQEAVAADVKPDAAGAADAVSEAANTDSQKSMSAYLKSYEHGNPKNFATDFSAVKKDLCQTCHTSGKTRQDCLTCHKYHVNGVTSPITSTKLPTE